MIVALPGLFSYLFFTLLTVIRPGSRCSSYFLLLGDVPRRTPYGVYISKLIRFARASSNLRDFNCRNKALLPNFLGRAIVILNFARRSRNFIAEAELRFVIVALPGLFSYLFG